MDIDEHRLSPQSKQVLATVRREMEAMRIPKDQADFLAKCVKVKDSLGILGDFAIKLAAVVGAGIAIWNVIFWGRGS